MTTTQLIFQSFLHSGKKLFTVGHFEWIKVFP